MKKRDAEWIWKGIVGLAIVAAISLLIEALRNYSQPPYRSFVSQARTDMRNLASALEAYHAHAGVYPPAAPFVTHVSNPAALKETGADTRTTFAARGASLTTPVAFLDRPYLDPFTPDRAWPYAYYTDGKQWILVSPGPDGHYDLDPAREFALKAVRIIENQRLALTYDPSNGTVSDGDIWRAGP